MTVISEAEQLFTSLRIPGVGPGLVRKYAKSKGIHIDQAPSQLLKENPLLLSQLLRKDVGVIYEIQEALASKAKAEQARIAQEMSAEAILAKIRERNKAPFWAIAIPNTSQLTAEQSNLIHLYTNNPISFISGPAGTGKTTMIREIYKSIDKVEVCAPTGKAAANLIAKGIPAKTIHRLLEYNPIRGWKYNKENPLKCSTILVDESSMLNCELIYKLLECTSKTQRIVFFGDSWQLPPVEGEAIFHSYAEKKAELTKVMRQQDSDLLRFITKYRETSSPLQGQSALRHDGTVELNCRLGSLYNDLRKATKKIKDGRILILCPFNVGRHGADSLNKSITQILNLNAVGSRVMQTANNYMLHDEGIFNGEIGTIVAYDKDITTVLFPGNKVVDYSKLFVTELQFAYALSVHKSQGSEFEEVWFVIDPHMPKPSKQMVYTALTRAQKRVKVYGEL